MKSYNVIINDFNTHKMLTYDVIPYFVRCYKEAKDKPTTFEEFKEFVKSKSMYMFWSRCEWEIILSDWPTSGKCNEKWDVHDQIMMNHDIVTNILMETVNGQV